MQILVTTAIAVAPLIYVSTTESPFSPEQLREVLVSSAALIENCRFQSENRYEYTEDTPIGTKANMGNPVIEQQSLTYSRDGRIRLKQIQKPVEGVNDTDINYDGAWDGNEFRTLDRYHWGYGGHIWPKLTSKLMSAFNPLKSFSIDWPTMFQRSEKLGKAIELSPPDADGRIKAIIPADVYEVNGDRVEVFLDTNQGLMPIEENRYADGRLVSQQTASFQEVNGVWVLKEGSLVRFHRNKEENGKPSIAWRWQMTVKEAQVNAAELRDDDVYRITFPEATIITYHRPQSEVQIVYRKRDTSEAELNKELAAIIHATKTNNYRKPAPATNCAAAEQNQNPKGPVTSAEPGESKPPGTSTKPMLGDWSRPGWTFAVVLVLMLCLAAIGLTLYQRRHKTGPA